MVVFRHYLNKLDYKISYQSAFDQHFLLIPVAQQTIETDSHKPFGGAKTYRMSE